MAAAFTFAVFSYFPLPSPDLMATWLAGTFLNSGQPDLVYPPSAEVFDMYPPEQWRAFMADHYLYRDAIYPFLYPPIWAKVGQVMAHANYWVVTAVAFFVNTALLLASTVLAWRACRPSFPPQVFVALALVFLFFTHIGSVALSENQPQILVSFLMIAAIERSRSGAQLTAGLALALAASIKIYPALFALLWLAGGNRRAVASFLISGAGLFLLSLTSAGWYLHVAFLDQLRTISRSVLVTGITFNIEAALAQILYRDELTWIPAIEPPTPSTPDPGWFIMARPATLRIVSVVMLAAALTGLARLFRISDEETRATIVWPLALIVVPMSLPIAWAYYYIPVACFAPIVLDKLPRKSGVLVLVVSYGMIFGPTAKYIRDLRYVDGFPPYPFQLVAVLSLAVLAAGFLAAFGKSRRLSNEPSDVDSFAQGRARASP